MAYDLINIGTPNGNNGDTIRDAFKKSNDNDAYLKQKVDGFGNSIPSVISDNGVTVLTPLDGHQYLGYSTVPTGAIKIALPQNYIWTSLYLEILVSHIYSGVSSLIRLKSRINPTAGWEYGFFDRLGQQYTVRLGNDGDKACIYIGELNNTFTYTHVNVLKGVFAYYNYSVNQWLTGWNIGIESSIFQNVNRTY